jgi:hypothetical protein
MINDSVAAKGLHCDLRDSYRTWVGISRTNSWDGIGPARCTKGFHLTKKACSVLINTISYKIQVGSLSLVRFAD